MRSKFCNARVAGAQGGFCRNESEPGEIYCEVHADVPPDPSPEDAPFPKPWVGIEEATTEELRERLYAIGPPWGNPKLLARDVEEGFWIAFEALDRLEAK